jgi:hypothetical protein
MLSSGDVAQMFMAQNQMFMGQNQHAQHIGVPSPQGLGAFGAPSSMVRTGVPPLPGMMAPPPVVSYDPNRSMTGSYGTGNRGAATAMSALGGMAAVGAGMMFDPFSMFARTALPGVLGGAGMGVSAGLMAAAPVALAGMAAQRTIGTVVQGAQQQQMINTTLGQNFGFQNQASRTGFGFNRQDAMAIGDNIRHLSHIPEMMTSVEELTRLIPKLKASGAMQGVRDVTEFNRRFKDAVSTIRDMSKVLGTTMEEASEFFAQSRSAGFFGKTAQVRNVLNAQLTGGLTGMSTGQVLGMQQAGANMATSMGARRSLGATAVTNIAQQIGMAQQGGRLAEGLIEDVTGGVGGADGVQIASQKMAGMMAQMFQGSSAGRFMLAGMVKFDERGRAIGVDEEKARRLREGSVSMDELRGAGMRLNDKQKISFMNRIEDLSMSAAGQIGPGGAANFIDGLVGNRGEEASRLVLRRQAGLSSQDADLAMSLRNMDFGDIQGMARKSASESAIRERTDPEMIARRLKTRMAHSLTAPLKELGAKIQDAVASGIETFIDEAVGRHSVSISKQGADALTRAMGGGSNKDLVSMFSAASGITSGSRAASLAARERGGMSLAGSIGGGLIGFGVAAAFNERGAKGVASDIGEYWGSTDMSAFINKTSTTTGRRADVEYEVTKGLYGASDANFGRISGMLNKGIGINSDLAAASKGELEALQSGIEGFGGMSDAEKLRTLKKSVDSRVFQAINVASEGEFTSIEQARASGRLPELLSKMEARGGSMGSAAALIRSGEAASGKFGGDYATGIISASQGAYEGLDSQINFAGVATGEGNTNFLNVKAAAAAMTKAEEGLRAAGLNDTTLAMIKSRPALRGLVESLAGGDAKVKKAIDTSDPKEAVRKLQELGYTDVTEADIGALKQASGDIFKGGDAKAIAARVDSIRDGLQTFANAERGASGLAILNKFSEQAGEMQRQAKAMEDSGNSAGAQALRDVAEKFAGLSELRNMGGSPEERTKAFESALTAAKGSITEVTRTAMSMSEKDRAAFLGGAGNLGSGIRSAIAGGKRLKQGMSVDEAMEAFNLGNSKEARGVIEGVVGMGGSVDMKLKDRLVEAVAGIKGVAAKEGDTDQALSKDEQVLKTLKGLDETLKLTNTVLAANSSVPAEIRNKVNAAAGAGEGQAKPTTPWSAPNFQHPTP